MRSMANPDRLSTQFTMVTGTSKIGDNNEMDSHISMLHSQSVSGCTLLVYCEGK
ncbi:hypothetical protein PISMIDRAFT_493056 [Pisolithus microcarpus 441]|uniref:Uncharacterized protein n=1 Tax=Pisolithus microcarpus 441 TaxID=765257 RepID=A0A0C9ZJP7_9AGAM|nr:hypothetical protein PISMIDRAFT_493056 [Pisolithus microcarpus 441]